MNNHPKLYLIIVVGLALGAGLLIGWQWLETSTTQYVSALTINEVKSVGRAKSALRNVKGIYLTAYSAGSEKKINEIINLLNKTELNAVVIDIKDYSGKILYKSNLTLAKEYNLSENRLGDVKKLVDKLHDNNIYVIARQTVFQDPLLASKKPEWAIKSNVGGLWYDNKGLTWVDPTRIEVWNYNVELAREVIDLGFDEINFDYVRFPSDGNMSLVVYNIGDEPRYEVMKRFYNYLRNKLDDEPVWISLDMFGYVMERTDDLRIGQRLIDAVDSADYICPMMYPSHYSRNSLGHENPAEIPGAIIENGMIKGMPSFKDKLAQVRPWLQAFDIGAVYSDGIKIREQIDMVEKYSDAGWLLWNAGNRYSANGLKKE